MKPAYVVRWQSANMPAPSFWYFAMEHTARETAKGFTAGIKAGVMTVTINKTEVPDDFLLEDE